MSLQPNYITFKDAGLMSNKKPFLMMDNAFQQLDNAYVWRERIKKREGLKLVGRLRRTFTAALQPNSVTVGAGTGTFNIFTAMGITGEPNAAIEPGTAGSPISLVLGAPLGQTWTDATGTGVMTGFAAPIDSVSINYSTGDVTYNNTGAGFGAVTLTITLGYFPSLPVMGIDKRELAAINVEQTTFFDTKYVYTYNDEDFTSPSTTVWAGTDAEFFWMENYRGVTADSRLFFVTNFASPSSNVNNRIRYTADGATYTTFAPGVAGTLGTPETADATFIWQTKLIVAYYGRLLFLNTWEGPDSGGPNPASAATNFFNRCRFSQIGDPTQATVVGPPFVGGAWRSDVFGKGGFIDAPTNETIVSAQFFKNTLIVFFEKTTWQLRYVGEYGLPFLWERISSDFGSESKLSTVLFDSGVLAIGDKAIVASSGNDVQRIDLDIPDVVFNIHNQQDGKERVHGVRDFQKEIVYWSYPDGAKAQKFPDLVLLYNYRNNTWAIFRDNVTVFGELTNATGDSWDSPISWDSDTTWDFLIQGEIPLVVSGNQQGYVHYYQSFYDPDDIVDSTVPARENESLQITNITRSTTANLQITSPDHNLQTGELVYIDGLLFVDLTTTPDTALSTNLNDRIYQVIFVDANTIDLKLWNAMNQSYQPTDGTTFAFTPATGTGTYMGGGQMTLFPVMNMVSKDFNPYQNQGMQYKTCYTDFMTDGTPNSAVSVNVFVNTARDVSGNLPVWNSQMLTTTSLAGQVTAMTNANPCVITSANHGLFSGRSITMSNITGMVGATPINNTTFIVTFISTNTFSIDLNTAAYTAYQFGGRWRTNDEGSDSQVWKYYTPGQLYAWHRFYATVSGQYLSYQITYDDDLMNQLSTHQSGFELNAMIVWSKPGGRFPS